VVFLTAFLHRHNRLIFIDFGGIQGLSQGGLARLEASPRRTAGQHQLTPGFTRMIKLYGILLSCLGLMLATCVHAEDKQGPQLPLWQSLEFEQKAFWATAKSLLEVNRDAEDDTLWNLDVESSVVSNSEQINTVFEPDTGKALSRARISRGSGQRMKSYRYDEESVLRERRNQPEDRSIPTDEWPVSSGTALAYPASMADTVLTTPYLLVLLAQQLQAEGLDKTREVLVLTDKNFYRVRMTSGRGIPIEADYEVRGKGQVRGPRDTVAVSIHANPEGELADDDDFSLLGLYGDIIIFFDSESRLPVQVRGQAPRIGETGINLKSVTMRQDEK
jgi:hypothetical protein